MGLAMMEPILEGLQEAASFLAALEPAPVVPMTAALVLVLVLFAALERVLVGLQKDSGVFVDGVGACFGWAPGSCGGG